MTIEELALKAYPVKYGSIGDEHLWDMNEQYRECWIEGYKQALSLSAVSNHVCRTFVPDMTLTSATKCKLCGKEKLQH